MDNLENQVKQQIVNFSRNLCCEKINLNDFDSETKDAIIAAFQLGYCHAFNDRTKSSDVEILLSRALAANITKMDLLNQTFRLGYYSFWARRKELYKSILETLKIEIE